MQYEAKTPAEYLEVLDDDWRKQTLLELRKLIKKKAPRIQEGIEYKMLRYGSKKFGPLCHLNAQRNYVSLYVGDWEKIDASGDLLEGLNCGKGCVRFKKSNDVSETRIGEFLERAVEMWKAGEDLGC